MAGGSIAAQWLSVGDTIITLEREDARTLCHFDACDLVKHSGKKLNMTVRKAASTVLVELWGSVLKFLTVSKSRV